MSAVGIYADSRGRCVKLDGPARLNAAEQHQVELWRQSSRDCSMLRAALTKRAFLNNEARLHDSMEGRSLIDSDRAGSTG